jgi:pimeloyl-ACP methyl ester carboxylesterase
MILQIPTEGRALEVLAAGPKAGTLLVFHHGSPGAAVAYAPFIQACSVRGIRLALYSRPGFGESGRDEGRRVASAAADAAAVADHLGADRFLTAGWSGGGPHALACAALLPDRVLACATVAGAAPFDGEGLDWTAGMGEENRIEYSTAARDPGELLRWMEPQVAQLAQVRPDEIVAAMRSLISPVDEAHLTGEFADFLAASFHAAFRHGPWGWYDDDLAFTRPWGFDLGSIRVPVSVWQGPHDLMVPFAHGQWLAKHVAGASGRFPAEHGHISLIAGIGVILDELLRDAGRPGASGSQASGSRMFEAG